MHRTLKTELKVGGDPEILYELHSKLAPRLGIGEQLAIPSVQNKVSTSPTSQRPAAAAAPTLKLLHGIVVVGQSDLVQRYDMRWVLALSISPQNATPGPLSRIQCHSHLLLDWEPMKSQR